MFTTGWKQLVQLKIRFILKNVPVALNTHLRDIQFRLLIVLTSEKSAPACSGIQQKRFKPMKRIRSNREAGPDWMQFECLSHFLSSI